MLSLKSIFQAENIHLELDVTNQRVRSCALVVPMISGAPQQRKTTPSAYGWSLRGYEAEDGYHNPTVQTLASLGYKTKPLDLLELDEEATVQMVHLEECFPTGVASVRKFECRAQAAIAQFGEAIADLSRRIPNLTLAVSAHCLIFGSHITIDAPAPTEGIRHQTLTEQLNASSIAKSNKRRFAI